MKYYNYEMAKRMALTDEDTILQKHFPDSNKWGAVVYFDNQKNVEFMEICKLSQVTQSSATWTSYANIQWYDDNCTWEVNTQFNGKDEDEMWIFAYYKRFSDAVKFIANGKIETKKPIKIYK